MAELLWSADNISAVKSDGTAAAAVRTGASKGCTLTSGTWYFELGASVREVEALEVHLQWAAAVAGTAQLAFSAFSALEADGTTADVTSYSQTAGDWIPQDPDGASIDVVGTGNRAKGAIATLGGTNAGGATWELSDVAARRIRVELTLSNGGLVRCAVNAKG